jgi:hypothetical protein
MANISLSLLFCLLTITCMGSTPAPLRPVELAIARDASQRSAEGMVRALKAGDEKSFGGTFASESSFERAQAWSFLPAESRHENYLAIRESFIQDLQLIRQAGKGLDWSTAVVARVREIGSVGDEIEGLEIELSFGTDIEIARCIITGPLVLEGKEWKFIGRSRAPLLL